MKRLWIWIGSLVALSFVGFGIAIVFQKSDAPILVPIIYAATGAFLVAMALVVPPSPAGSRLFGQNGRAARAVSGRRESARLPKRVEV